MAYFYDPFRVYALAPQVFFPHIREVFFRQVSDSHPRILSRPIRPGRSQHPIRSPGIRRHRYHVCRTARHLRVRITFRRLQVLGQQPGKRLRVGNARKERFNLLPAVDRRVRSVRIFEESVHLRHEPRQVIAVLTADSRPQVAESKLHVIPASPGQHSQQLVQEFSQRKTVCINNPLRNRCRIDCTSVFL